VISNKSFKDDPLARMNFYLSTNTNYGATYCIDYNGGANARLNPHGYKFQYAIEMFHNGTTNLTKLFYHNGADYWAFTDLLVNDAYVGWDASHTTSEVKIAWSKFGLSVGRNFWIHGYITDSSSDYVYSTWPTVNTKESGNLADTSADKFYQFTITNGVTPNAAGNIKP
jgi:hypothetical protein